MPTQKEMIEEILKKQKQQGALLLNMDTALRGAEYDAGDGGLIEEVHQNTKCIKDIKKKQNKIITWGVTLFGCINLAAVIFTIISQIRN